MEVESGERYKRRDSGMCVGVGFNPSSALEEAGVTQIETNWLFALTISLVLFTVSRK